MKVGMRAVRMSSLVMIGDYVWFGWVKLSDSGRGIGTTSGFL